MTGPGRPGGLGIGDRVRFGGRDQVVIGVPGPAVRLADAGGEVVTVSVSGLLAAGDFAVLDARPRPGVPAVSVLDGLPAEALQEARWWQRHIVEVLTGIPPDAEDGTVPRPEYDPAVVTLTRREQAKAAELTAAGRPVTASAIAKRRRRYQEQGLIGMIDHRAGQRMPPHGRRCSCCGGRGRSSQSPAGNRMGECRHGALFTACSAGFRTAGTRPGRRGPADRWPAALRGRSGRCPRQRPVT